MGLVALAAVIGSLVGRASEAKAAFPGANGKLVFMSSRDGGDYDIFSVDADGSDLTNLTTGSAAFDWYPDVSADGTKIVFSSDADGDYEIYSMNADGTGRTQLTHNTAFDAQPAWSPDGSEIVFSRGGSQLYVINADGTGERLVEPGPNSETPEWSPDGSKIVFEANRNGSNVDIFVVAASGGSATRLTTDAKRDLLPEWSPDGSKIAFVSDRVCSPFCYSQIWVMDSNGSNQAPLTATAPAQNEWPAWSPDGSKISFSRSNAAGGWDLWVMNVDSSDQALVTTGGTFNNQVDWGVEPGSPLRITSVNELADPVARFERFEASIELSETFTNPFDPDEIAVDVTFTSPSGRAQVVPAFWYEPFTASGTSWEEYASGGSPEWRVRFTPDEVGTYTYSVAAAAGARTALPVGGTLQATTSSREGFVRIDDRNGRYLRFDSGEPYVPVGHNVAFEEGGPPLNGVGYYTNLLTPLGRAGENWSRVWMTDFNRSALEWGDGHYSGFYRGPGVYSLPSAWRMDRILELAEGNGVFVQLVLNDHGQVSTRGSDRWGVRCAASDPPPCQPGDEGYDPGHAYSAHNGGPVPVARPDLFFSSGEARELMKKRLRYVIARWGAFRSVLAWELFNEVAFVGTDSTNPFSSPQLRSDIVDWHADMAQYLKTSDPFGHLVTTSQAIQDGAGDITELNAIWELPAIDLVQIHWYAAQPERTTTDLDGMIDQFKARYGKPVIVGELGLPTYPSPDPPPSDFVNPERVGFGDVVNGFNPSGFVRPANPDFGPENRDHLQAGTHLHNAMWATAVSESGAMYWWWGVYIASDTTRNRVGPDFPLNERLVPPLLAYLGGEDWAPLGLDTASITTSGPIVAVGSSSPTRAYMWVRDAENEYGTGSRPGDLAVRNVSGARVDLAGMADGSYQIQVHDTWTSGTVAKTLFGVVTDGILTVTLPSFTRDVALKLVRLPDADGDGVVDDVDPDGGTGTSPAGSFTDDRGDGKTTSGAVLSGSLVSVIDVADPKGVRLTAGDAGAVVLACGQGYELELPPGSSVTLTCGSITVEEIVAGPVRVTLPGRLVTISVPAGVRATVETAADGRFTVTGVSGGTVTVTVDGITTQIAAGGSLSGWSWDFTGFLKPLDNPLNTVKAGSTVQLKWLLTDGSRTPVSTLSGAVLRTRTVACTTLAATGPVVKQTTSFAYLGKGLYRLDWATRKTDANTCAKLMLDIGDGVTHNAHVKFAK